MLKGSTWLKRRRAWYSLSARDVEREKVVAWKCQCRSKSLGEGKGAGIFTEHPFTSSE